MKVALVHELLTMKGGAERTVRVLADMFPDAPIYTLLYDEQKLGDWFPKERVRVSSTQGSSFNHHRYLSKFPAAVEAWDFSEFDLVISSSSAFAHGIITNGKPRHISYIHSPARYLWDRTHDVLDRAGEGFLGSLKRFYLSRLFHKLRIRNSESSERPDVLIAASKEVQRRIQLYWRRESTVIYPPLDDQWLTAKPQPVALPRDYFLVVSTLARYKRIDLAIEACEKIGKRLIIIGDGADMARLKKLAGPNTEFRGRVDGQGLIDMYGSAQAVIFPGEEDFGLVPLEANACGTPVIGYRAGGALETIIEGKTGEFFDEATPESLAEVLKKFDNKKYDKETMRNQARGFSKERFMISFLQEI